MAEQPRRLTPEPDTLRELFLKSGNLCAFPGCNHLMMNADGVFISQTCHIEAALPGGPRFNPNQTNEKRRAFSNLMLMCHDHHKVTDDVSAYTVERLQEIKAAHEAIFTDVGRRIAAAFVDEATTVRQTNARTLKRFSAEANWPDLTDEELAESVAELEQFSATIGRLPRSTRELLAILVSRGEETSLGARGGLIVLLREIARACGRSERYVVEEVQILERYDLAFVAYDEKAEICVYNPPGGWPFWLDLKVFCDHTGVTLHEIVVELRFDLLD